MQKTRSHSDASISNNRWNHSTIPLPEVVTIDTLGTMLDEDLNARYRSLEEDKNKAYAEHLDARPWEEELAYVRREQQLRRVRRDHHVEFLREEQRAFEQSEVGLPAGDFDNSNFVYAASGGRPRWN